MLLILAWSIVYGSETTTNLTMWKFCRMELNYTEEICSNLSNGKKKFKYIFLSFIKRNDLVNQLELNLLVRGHFFYTDQTTKLKLSKMF